jgi:hypothetical protein
MGEYDFSDEKLRDSVGIKPPKIDDLNEAECWELQNGQNAFVNQRLAKFLCRVSYLCGNLTFVANLAERAVPGGVFGLTPDIEPCLHSESCLFHCGDTQRCPRATLSRIR